MEKIINKRSLSDDFEEMLLNLDKIEEENLIDLKKLSSLDVIASLSNETSTHGIAISKQLGRVSYLHKCYDGTILDIRGNHLTYKKMDDDHLKNLLKYTRNHFPHSSKLVILKDEMTKRGLTF
jgi:hypothetical protein